MSTIKKFIAFSDLHVPIHSEQCLRILCNFAKDFEADEIVNCGDSVNLDQLSTHPNEEKMTVREEYDLANAVLDQIVTAGGKRCKHTLIAGNHDQRATRIGNLDSRIHSMLDPVENLHLKGRGIKYVPYRHDKWHSIGPVKFVHGFSCGIHVAAAHAAQFGVVIHGHSHREQHFVSKTADRREAWSLGCMLDIDKVQYNRQWAPSGWTNGFCYGYVSGDDYHVYQVRINENGTIIDGQRYV